MVTYWTCLQSLIDAYTLTRKQEINTYKG